MQSKKPLTLFIITAILVFVLQIFYNILFIGRYIFQINLQPRFFYIPPLKNTTGNIPESYFTGTYHFQSQFNHSCARSPTFFDLRIRNNNWQLQDTSNGTFHLFSAYVDRRNGTVVRILGTYDQWRPEQEFFCQFWYQEGYRPVIVKSEVLFWLFAEGWGADNKKYHQPYLITCPLKYKLVPSSVSLVERECDNATNNIKIVDNFEEKKDFVVCVKGLSFPFEDNSARLVEWIELLDILGADKINFYEFSVHPNVKKLLEYYVSQGRIDVTPMTLVGDFSNRPFLQNYFLDKMKIQRRLQEVIPYNDCLYKHLGYKYVVLLDTDEVIVPSEGTWTEMIQNLRKKYPNLSSYTARNVYFLDSYLHDHDWFEDIPKDMHILQHVYRALNYTKPGAYVKGFHDTEKVVALHNHFPFGCFGACYDLEIDTEVAHLQHYRSSCVAEVDCTLVKKNNVLDTRVWNFKKDLIRRVKETKRVLEMLENS